MAGGSVERTTIWKVVQVVCAWRAGNDQVFCRREGRSGRWRLAEATARTLAMTVDPIRIALSGTDKTIMETAQVKWAIGQFASTAEVFWERTPASALPSDGFYRVCLLHAGSPQGAACLTRANADVPVLLGSYAIIPSAGTAPPGADLVAKDPVGFMYALLELHDILVRAPSREALLRVPDGRLRAPATPVRAIGRAFTSAAHDQGWYRSAEFWDKYLTMLAKNRFNQFDLAFGIGYDFPVHVTDAYFLFAYPFWVRVPGYDVAAAGLDPEEREANLAYLKLIATECSRRGLAFHLGLWTHSYRNSESPRANFLIEGLRDADHANYCRDALGLLLSECPEIRGVTLRTHGESGVPEGTEGFWGALFEACKQARPTGTFTIDLHAKGLTPRLIELAAATGCHVVVSAKFSAEHMGLPYQQASIREIDRLGRHQVGSSSQENEVRLTAQRLMALSLTSRSATRYSYGDFLTRSRDYDVTYRIWPGTQKLLAWADPLFANAYARASRFCGSSGLEVMEPLSFRGRRGSGLGGVFPRSGYLGDVQLDWQFDWEKYRDTYEVWGDALFGYQRPRLALGALGRSEDDRGAVLQALAKASRILPLVTSAHLPSAANVHYWPEIYTMPPVSKAVAGRSNVYLGDSSRPVRLGTISPLDPVVFSSAREFAEQWAKGTPDGRYSPLDVADWLVQLSTGVEADVRLAGRESALAPADVLRLRDAQALAQLGIYFARLFVAAVAYELYDVTGSTGYLGSAVQALKSAIDVWREVADALDDLYVEDLAFGEVAEGRGDWRLRLPEMEEELAQLRSDLGVFGGQAGQVAQPERAEMFTLSTSRLPDTLERRLPVPPGKLEAALLSGGPCGLKVRLRLDGSWVVQNDIEAVCLHYRHVNQLEVYEVTQMVSRGEGVFEATVPAEYLADEYPIQYFCEVRSGDQRRARLPSLGPGFDSQPYRVWEG